MSFYREFIKEDVYIDGLKRLFGFEIVVLSPECECEECENSRKGIHFEFIFVNNRYSIGWEH